MPNYREMLVNVNVRLEYIEQISLEEDIYNEERIQLMVMQSCLYKLLKLQKAMSA